MDYKKKELNIGNMRTSRKEFDGIFQTIMIYLKGECTNPLLFMTERARQYFTWGANKFTAIESKDGCYGIQFNVSGLIFKGRVRIYYNIGTDYFDVELIRARKEELVWGCNDIDCFQLHNVLHRHIERTDDVEV